jgi:hypothetical protein|tara:strand:+ start:545 stop:1012 length:468 start_codon:yes stop_codon:yes gene_type:complete
MKVEAFRKIIREEVRDVIKEELSLIMSTPVTETKVVQKPVVEQKTTKHSLAELTETVQPTAPQQPLFDSNDPIAQILNETNAAGEWRNLNGGSGYTAQDAVGFQGGMAGGETKVVSSVDEMMASQPKTSDINQVSIDAVPDFTGLMGKLKEDGKI